MNLRRFPVNESLVKEFDSLLEAPATDEHSMQAFLEEHPEFLYTPHLLNHGLHRDALISKFRLNTSLTTDFAYLTKSSNVWRLVLVELEPPSVQIFRSDGQATPTAEFTKRKTQIDEWRDAIRTQNNEILRPLLPLLQPMERNRVEFYFVLVIGRSPEPFPNQKWRDRMIELAGKRCEILTHDSLKRAYLAGDNRGKNVLAINKDVFRFKQLHIEPQGMFSHMLPHQLAITADQESLLKLWGYEMDAWKAGRPLFVNEKHPDVASRVAALGKVSP